MTGIPVWLITLMVVVLVLVSIVGGMLLHAWLDRRTDVKIAQQYAARMMRWRQ